MNIIVCENYEEMSAKVAEITFDIIRNANESLISFPGGDTPLGAIKEFVKGVNSEEVSIANTRFVSLDEWVGLKDTDAGSCGHFLKENLFSKLSKPFKDTYILNGANPSIEAEKEAHQKYFDTYGPLDLSVLGVGMNGHLGFNESGVEFSLDSHIMDLDDVTKKVMVKYFGDTQKPEKGITQGINQIMNAKTVIIIANGAHKADIIEKALKGTVSNLVPASCVQNHPNCYVILDKEAAAKL